MGHQYWLQLSELFQEHTLLSLGLILLSALLGGLLSWVIFRDRLKQRILIDQIERERDMAPLRERLTLSDALSQQLTEKNTALQVDLDQLTNQLHLCAIELAGVRSGNLVQEKHFREEIDRILGLRKDLVQEFEQLVARQLQTQQKQFSLSSEQKIDSLLMPLQRQLQDFRSRMDEVHTHDIAQTHQLLGQIQQLQKQSQQIGEDAVQLTKALKGNNKLQGNWGEWVLQRLLEQSGLHEGREFKTQVSHTSELGKKLQPDVVLYLPGDKHIVVDSKVSLIAYNLWVNSATEAEQKNYEKDLVQSIRQHIKDLSGKGYEQLESLQGLDFVVMFIPIEAAFATALQLCPELLGDAYAKNVVLAGPTTLMSILRCIETLWQREKQDKNVETIVVEAGKLHDHFVRFLESMNEVGQALERAKGAHDQAQARLSGGRGNLIKRVQNLQALGAKTQKVMMIDQFSIDEV